MVSKKYIFTILFVLGFIHAQTGHIQIYCEPNVNIFLDGKFMGATNSELGGLILQNISVGQHSLKAVKTGFQPREDNIVVTNGSVLEYTVTSFIPELKISETGIQDDQQIDKLTGVLMIQSLPVDCQINIQSLGLVNIKKSKDEWKVEEIPIGNYTCTFVALGKTLSYNVEILENSMTHLFIDFLSGKISEKSINENKHVNNHNNSSMRYNSSIKDIDNNVYNTIVIGKQEWMAENLKVKHYRNGDPIPNVTSDKDWKKIKSGAYCTYENHPKIELSFGLLYNWYAIKDNRNIAPEGWHIPSDEEWQELLDHLGGNEVAGGPLKSTGNKKENNGWWLEPNTGATNGSGFNAFPGGRRRPNYIPLQIYFENGGSHAYFWSSDHKHKRSLFVIGLNNVNTEVHIDSYGYKQYGLSVRCIRDAD